MLERIEVGILAGGWKMGEDAVAYSAREKLERRGVS